MDVPRSQVPIADRDTIAVISRPILYLVGVNHVVQFGEPSRATNSKIVREKRTSFRAHVSEMIERLNITVLAEEFNAEAKEKWGVSETTLETLSRNKPIEQHRFCSPGGPEDVWLSEIGDCKDKNLLFVCGNDHLETFRKMLGTAGFNVEVGPNSWNISSAEFHFSDP
jgi:hypothetical protein